MPHSVSWFRYISFLTLSFLSAACGSQVVHEIYRPLDDLDDLIEEAFQNRLSELQNQNFSVIHLSTWDKEINQ
ncbi:hypothetical protein K0M31_006435 [Melipona bicolor]|uniref:Uncharacterized protein n=1 Tax=Melipona bicolor TaxID=60889 RepID=A0AA40KLX1_9HYME|nr:hypothetical protein K0M31_006435 [Melipona bicolor]